MNTENMTSFQKAWKVLFPYLLYYLAYNAVYMILVFVQSVLLQHLGEEYVRRVTEHGAAVTGVTSGLCMLLGILPLLPMLKAELAACREECRPGTEKWVREALVTVALAVLSSLGLNMLLTLTGFAESSQTYQKVAENQYGVAFGIGIVLYGLVSPLAEEVVFRGVIYNRMRRLYGPVAAVIASGILFGAFHGNLVQGVYGACMGILIACMYERKRRFFIPVLFHAAANLAVYVTAHVLP